MKLLFNSFLLVLILITTSYADEASHRASAEEFLMVMKTDQMMKPMFQEIRKMMFDMSKQMGIPEEESELINRHMSRMIKMVEDEFGWDKLKDDYIRIYQETYTEDELKSFIAFYKTSAGQKFIEKMPLLMKKSMGISQKNMPAMMEKMKVLQAQMFEDIQNEIANQDKVDYDRAITKHNKAIEMNPADDKLYNNRGMTHLNKGDLDRALADFNKSIELNPENILSYLNLGLVYKMKGQYDKAISYYSKALKLNPEHDLSYGQRGECYINKGNYDKAIADFNKAIEFNPKNAAAYIERARAYYVKGDYYQSIADSSMGIRLEPLSMVAYNNRGFAYLELGELSEAEMDIKKAVKIDPDHYVPNVSMAEFYAVTNKNAEACKWLKKAIEKGFNDWNYIKTYRTFNNIRNASCYREIITDK